MELEARRLRWLYSSKAAGAWYLQCSSAMEPIGARVFYSSVGSSLANTGQANYATGNACLDAHASSQRAHGSAACIS